MFHRSRSARRRSIAWSVGAARIPTHEQSIVDLIASSQGDGIPPRKSSIVLPFLRTSRGKISQGRIQNFRTSIKSECCRGEGLVETKPQVTPEQLQKIQEPAHGKLRRPAN